MINYRKLCKFTIEHQYYAANNAQANDETPQLMQIRPTVHCQQLMKKSRTGFKVHHNQLLLYCQVNESQSGSVFLAPQVLRQPQVFTFSLHPAAVPLLDISAFADDLPQKSIVTFGNSQLAELDQNQGEGLWMTPKSTQQWQQKNYWYQLQKQQFFWPFVSDHQRSAKNWFLLKDKSAEKLPSELITQQEGGLQIDLREHSPGEYQLFSGKNKQASFYVDDNFCSQPPIAILTLQTGEGVAAEGQFIEPITGVIIEKNFKISIPARRTTWRYFIVPKYLSDKDQQLNIDVPFPQYQFKAAEQQPRSDGTTMFRFDSVQPIELSTTGLRGLTLHGNRQGVLIDNLPSPRAEQLVVEQGMFFSDQYIYV